MSSLAYTTITRRLAPYYGWLYHFDGTPRIDTTAAIIPEVQLRRLHHAAARVAGVYDELCALIAREPALLDYFELTPAQRTLWLATPPTWRGIARADVFLTTDGRVQICEINSDTPGGVPDALLFNQAVRDSNAHLWDPNASLGRDFQRWIAKGGVPATVGIVFPPELAEDTAIIFLYRDLLESMGCKVVLGAPANLHPIGDKVGLLGEPIDFMFRHYKTDEWVPQRNAWLFDPDAPIGQPPKPAVAEHRPTYEHQLAMTLNAMADNKLRLLNPFGTIVTQSKLSLAFMWDMRERFSPAAQRAISELVPETRKLRDIGRERVVAEQDHWVIKSSYGFEGNEAVCGRFESPERWRHLVTCLDPDTWVAQRFFEVQPEESGLLPNYGVFLIDGEPSGCLYRVSRFETNVSALSAPVFVALSGGTGVRVPAIHADAPVVERPIDRSAIAALTPVPATLPMGVWPPPPEQEPWEQPVANEDANPWPVIDAWYPYGSRWEPFAHTTPWNTQLKPGAKRVLPLITESMRRAYAQGEELLAKLAAEPDGGRDVLLWIDLNGEDSIAMAAALARVFTPVVRADGFDHPRGAVRLNALVGAMTYYAEELRGIRRPPDAPAAIIHCARRLIRCDRELGRVYNSYVGLIPPAELLVRYGVRRIRGVYEGSPDTLFAAPHGLLLEGCDEGFAAELCNSLVPTYEAPAR